MPINILMPALSPTMEKGNLSKWLKKEGDAIKSGDVIAEIETDKATMEVEAVDEGILAKITVAEGTADVPVNQVIGVIAGEGEDAKAVGAAGAAPAKAATAPDAATSPATTSSSAKSAEPAKGFMTASAAPPAEAPQQPAAAANGARIFASPLAKRLAREAGIDLSAIKGSGPRGRVVEKDVKGAIGSGTAPAAPAAAPAQARPPLPSGPSDETVKKLFPAGSFEEIPHDNMRKTIARRLTEAKTTIPHFYLSIDVDLDPLLALREQINAAAPRDKDGKPAYKVSVNDMVIKAYALALMAVPDANVSWTDGAMLRHSRADVGVAVSIPGGLITPVVRDAGAKSLSAISNEMKDLAARAKTRRLKPEEYQGGTGAVSNLGMFGITTFSAVINPPHATILAVGAGIQKPVARDGAVTVVTVMSLTLSTDHRAVDGALGAALIQAIKGYIEKPIGMLV